MIVGPWRIILHISSVTSNDPGALIPVEGSPNNKECINKYKGVNAYDKEYKYSIYGDKIKPIINNKVIIDIDTERDLMLVDAVMTNYKEQVGLHWKLLELYPG